MTWRTIPQYTNSFVGTSDSNSAVATHSTPNTHTQAPRRQNHLKNAMAALAPLHRSLSAPPLNNSQSTYAQIRTKQISKKLPKREHNDTRPIVKPASIPTRNTQEALINILKKLQSIVNEVTCDCKHTSITDKDGSTISDPLPSEADDSHLDIPPHMPSPKAPLPSPKQLTVTIFDDLPVKDRPIRPTPHVMPKSPVTSSLSNSMSFPPKVAKRVVKGKSAFKVSGTSKRVLTFPTRLPLLPSPTPLTFLPRTVRTLETLSLPLRVKTNESTAIVPVRAAATNPASSSSTFAAHNKFARLPEPLLFMLADSLLSGMEGLKEVTRLFTQLVHTRRTPAENAMTTLQLITKFINRPGHNYLSRILEIVEFKVENIPGLWKDAFQNCTTISLKGIENPNQVEDIVVFLPRLQELSLEKCTLNAEALVAIGAIPALQTLRFSSCKGITDDTFAPINNCRTLTSLTVRWCEQGLSDKAIKALTLRNANGAPSGLKQLNLDGNRQLTDESLTHITQTFPSLESLNLGTCILITERSFSQVETLTELKSLNLTYCKGLFQHGLAVIVKLKKLETLILKRFDFVNPDGVPSFLPLSKLQHLDLRLSSRLTNDILNKIAKIVSRLTYFSLYKSRGFSNEALNSITEKTTLDVQQRLSPTLCDTPRNHRNVAG